MKILKIEESKGLYSIDGENWQQIDVIAKEDLMSMMTNALEKSVEMDEFKEEEIQNQAHQIIYRSVYEKLMALVNEKDKFKDTSDRLYLKAFEKYQ